MADSKNVEIETKKESTQVEAGEEEEGEVMDDDKADDEPDAKILAKLHEGKSGDGKGRW